MEFPHVQYETCLHPCWTGGCSQMFQLAVLVYHYPIIGQARAALVIFFVSPGDWSLRSLLLVKPVQHSGHFEVLVISILLFYRHPAIAQRQKRGGESRRHASLPSWQFWSSFLDGASVTRSRFWEFWVRRWCGADSAVGAVGCESSVKRHLKRR